MHRALTRGVLSRGPVRWLRREQCSTASLSALCSTAEIVKEVSTLGLPSALVGPEKSLASTSERSCSYVLRHPECAAPLACIHRNGMILHTPSTHGDLSLDVVAPLLEHAREALWPEQVRAVAALPGLPAWVAAMPTEVLEDEFGQESAEAVRAVALGQPRKGHSVLGYGTFTAARAAWGVLAARYAASAEASEALLYRNAGGWDMGVACFLDTSPAAMASYGGAMALYAFPDPSAPVVEDKEGYVSAGQLKTSNPGEELKVPEGVTLEDAHAPSDANEEKK